MPRIDQKKFDEKLPLPNTSQLYNDRWSEKKVTFGQNDYIDIFGDGSLHPVDLINGPNWLIGWRGNEMQRIIRRLKFGGDKLKMEDPSKYADIRRRLRYVYKKFNIKFGGKKK